MRKNPRTEFVMHSWRKDMIGSGGHVRAASGTSVQEQRIGADHAVVAWRGVPEFVASEPCGARSGMLADPRQGKAKTNSALPRWAP
ncbi:MAG: hypothetical protein K0S81_793 [Rhodospirillales bacterium]|nr:hypothetical protein [Rhodospirillales bacterium]